MLEFFLWEILRKVLMARKIQKLFRSPYAAPNGVQITDDGLWIVDQITDRVALVEMPDQTIEDYGLSNLIRDIPSESSNTSGMAYGDGALWLTANGPGALRNIRSTDAKSNMAEILKVNLHTGETLDRYPIPGGGGSHGVEYDHFEEGYLWVQILKDQKVAKIKINDWSVERLIPLPHERGHGMVRVKNGIWVVHTSHRVIVKLDLDDGTEIDRIEIPESAPEPHGLTYYEDDLIYCDASSGWIVKIMS